MSFALLADQPANAREKFLPRRVGRFEAFFDEKEVSKGEISGAMCTTIKFRRLRRFSTGCYLRKEERLQRISNYLLVFFLFSV